jgi:glutamate synthase (NADPH/NADH) small chain
MGKATGFLEYRRALPVVAAPAERLRHWSEFHGHLSNEELQAQAARCMDCGIPFCHAGTVLAGAASGCPLHNLIPEWNDLVYRGHWREALERLHRTNNFPEFTGRVCPAPCEGSCVLGIHEPAVAIKAVECALADRGFAEGWVVAEPPRRRTGKRVAVVGSGPAGLAAAAQLNFADHRVTVFERADRAGGLLTYGIPNMKLDKATVQRRVDLLATEGVRFRTGTEVGVDFPAARLLDEFEASVLCGGATRPRDLPVEGRQLEGVHFAMDFLRSATKRLLDPGGPGTDGPTAAGKDVVVIGGGDTGTDCVATALRQGCRSLVQLEILPRPPDSRAPDNPWPQWPRVFRLDYGQEEAASRFGCDPRQYRMTASRFLGDDSGRVRAVEVAEVEVPGTARTLPAQLVLLALGFLGPENTLLDQLGVERDSRSNARALPDHYATNVPGIFAAGDMRRGQSLVVWAIHEGRGAARECDRYLMGETFLP